LDDYPRLLQSQEQYGVQQHPRRGARHWLLLVHGQAERMTFGAVVHPFRLVVVFLYDQPFLRLGLL
jgi:hypothetical protein